MLEIKDLAVHFDGAIALNNVSLSVRDKEFVAVVGPNGAGKTSLLRAISGLLTETQTAAREHPQLSGTITLMGKRVDKLRPHQIVRRGIIHCPERRRLFSEMTVRENLEMGAYLRHDSKEIKKETEWVLKLFPVLKERANQMAGTLSGGEQQMLAIGRALMSKPKLLLIDEPSLGLAPLLKEEMFKRVKEIHRSGVTVLLVEQDVSVALDMADRIYVLAHGRIVAEGKPAELMKNTDVREIYLGI